jgi:hypothetical protein
VVNGNGQWAMGRRETGVGVGKGFNF